MSAEQLLYIGCGGLVSAVVFLFLTLQKRNNQMIELMLQILREKNGKDKKNGCPFFQEDKEKKALA